MKGDYARYLLGWAIAAGLLVFALTTLFPGVAGGAGAPAVFAGVGVMAATDLVVFAIVLRALTADARRFPKLWGLSVLFKAFVIGSSIALVSILEIFPLAGFVQVLIVSFVVFSHHEVFQLAFFPRKSDRVVTTAPARS